MTDGGGGDEGADRCNPEGPGHAAERPRPCGSYSTAPDRELLADAFAAALDADMGNYE